MDFLSFFICFEKVIVFCEEPAALLGVFGWKELKILISGVYFSKRPSYQEENIMYRKKIDEYIRRGIFDGAVVVAGTEKDDLLRHTQGLADRNTGRAMSLDTVFDISSISKPLGTATGILLLAEQGKLELDRCFTDYLPEYAGNMPQPIDFRMLASHFSGLEPDYPLGVEADELIKRMLHSSFIRKPWQEFFYSCVNYHFMGFIIEKLSGTGLDEFARKNIFEPLGMTDTAWATPLEHVRERLVIHSRCVDSDPGVIFDRWARILHPRAVGNAGIFTTALDMSRYARMLLRGGEGVFSTDIAQKEMFCNYMPNAARCRSFGWDMTPSLLLKNSSDRAIFHSGSSGQSMWIDSKKGRFCIVLTNLFGNHDDGIAARLDVANAAAEVVWKD